MLCESPISGGHARSKSLHVSGVTSNTVTELGRVTSGMSKMTRRRGFVKCAAAAAAILAVGAITGRYIWTSPTASSCAASLRAAAETRGLLIGAALSPEGLRYWGSADTLAREFNFLTTENAMKWYAVHPAPQQWDFHAADTIVEFASEHQMKVKGHNIIWTDERTPEWVKAERTSEEFRQMLQKHIQTLVGRYKGKVYAWDVVNEAVDTREANGLRKTVFLKRLGEGYIAEAFHMVHEADPDALLFYNDSDAESVDSSAYRKTRSDRVYELVKKLLSDGVPIHGVGLQMHLDAWDYPRPADVAANVRRLAQLGLKVNISEMDVRITEKELPGTLAERLEIQRRIYHDIIAACVKEKGFMAITFWGFTDAYSWIDERFGPDDPLLFDEYYKPKPAYWGVMDALLEE